MKDWRLEVFDEDEPVCPRCLEPYTDDNPPAYNDPDNPCMNCMQQKADLLHDQMRERDIP